MSASELEEECVYICTSNARRYYLLTYEQDVPYPKYLLGTLHTCLPDPRLVYVSIHISQLILVTIDDVPSDVTATPKHHVSARRCAHASCFA